MYVYQITFTDPEGFIQRITQTWYEPKGKQRAIAFAKKLADGSKIFRNVKVYEGGVGGIVVWEGNNG